MGRTPLSEDSNAIVVIQIGRNLRRRRFDPLDERPSPESFAHETFQPFPAALGLSRTVPRVTGLSLTERGVTDTPRVTEFSRLVACNS